MKAPLCDDADIIIRPYTTMAPPQDDFNTPLKAAGAKSKPHPSPPLPPMKSHTGVRKRSGRLKPKTLAGDLDRVADD